MKGQSRTWRQLTFEDIPNITSLLESGDGLPPSILPAGPEIDPFFQARAHARVFRSRGSEKDSPTPATCGPCGSSSSASAALQFCLVSRLKARLDTGGSIEYVLTWKDAVTPLGLPYCRLVASARRISGTDFSGLLSGYPTPDHHHHGTAADPLKAIRESGQKVQKTLQDVATLCGWQSATADYNEAGNTDSSRATVALLAGWATATSRDAKDGACQNAKVPVNGLLGRQAAKPVSPPGPTTQPSDAATVSSGESRPKLNPAFVAWLMGFPLVWVEAGERAMVTAQGRSRSRRGKSRAVRPCSADSETQS